MASTSLRRGIASTVQPCSLVARGARRRPLDTHALAILIPRHALSTETNLGPGGAPAGPPPGFNADQAKKPLRAEQPTKPATSRTKSDQPLPVEPQPVPNDVATGEPKTPATDSISLTKLAKEKNGASAESLAETKKEQKKLTLVQKIKKEVLHYWDGTKLLATEVKISSKLLFKMAAGYELSRREHRQVLASTAPEGNSDANG